MSYLDNLKTATGVPAAMIQDSLDQQYDDADYEPITLAGGHTGASLSFEAVRQRVEGVFGPAGIGWRLIAEPGVAKGYVTSEPRPVYNEKGEQTGEKIWHIADMILFRFEYCLFDEADHKFYWFTACTVSASRENINRDYALRGVWTGLLKQAVRILGGYDHIYDGDVDDLVKAKAKAKKQNRGGYRQDGPRNSQAGADEPLGDSFSDGRVVGDFLKSWLEKGLKSKQVLEILGVQALTELASRQKADEKVTAFLAEQAAAR